MKIKHSQWQEIELTSYYDSKKLYDEVIVLINEDIEKIVLPPIEQITEDLLIAILIKDVSCNWTKDFIVEHTNYYNYTLYDYLHTLCVEIENDLLIGCKQEISDYGDFISSAKREIIKGNKKYE